MKKLTTFFVMILLVFVFPFYEQANTQDNPIGFPGSQLVDMIKDYEKFESGDYGVNTYKVGFYEGFTAGIAWKCPNTCAESNVTMPQIWAVVSKFLKENPERWNEPAGILVTEAFQEAFPCNR
jgi:hypothetical protein